MKRTAVNQRQISLSYHEQCVLSFNDDQNSNSIFIYTIVFRLFLSKIFLSLKRKNYPLLLPHLAAAELLTTDQAAIVASIFEVVVGLVKLICGVSESPPLMTHTLNIFSSVCLFVYFYSGRLATVCTVNDQA